MNIGTKTPGAPKKPYASPKLVRHGDVRVLIQAGTMGGSEGSMTMDTARRVSDRAHKENITRISQHPLGIGLYLFDYKPEFRDLYGHGKQFGVMADELEIVLPGAVFTNSDGHKTVDYAMLGVRHSPR